MLNIGERIIQLRKQKKISQQELAKAIGVSRTIVGNYERNLNAPSIETILKISNIFEVSVDFLLGEGNLANFDRDVVRRIEDIEKLDKNTKEHLFFLIDNVIQNFKTRQAFA